MQHSLIQTPPPAELTDKDRQYSRALDQLHRLDLTASATAPVRARAEQRRREKKRLTLTLAVSVSLIVSGLVLADPLALALSLGLTLTGFAILMVTAMLVLTREWWSRSEAFAPVAQVQFNSTVITSQRCRDASEYVQKVRRSGRMYLTFIEVRLLGKLRYFKPQ